MSPRRAHLLESSLQTLEARVLLTQMLDPFTQPKFVNPLPNPLDSSFIWQPTTPGGSHYEIAIRQTVQSLGLVDPTTGQPLMTRVWGYGNDLQPPTFPGRSFVVNRDQTVTVNWLNELVDEQGNPLSHLLPVDSTLHWADPLGQGHVAGPYSGPVPVVTHLHGGHTRSDSDGLPDAWSTPDSNDADLEPDYTGRLYNPDYVYDNDQEAGTLWYHDHALGITRLNVYAGLAGFYILRDGNEQALIDSGKLPSGPYEIPMAIQDRLFTADGQLYYPTTEMESDMDPDVPTHMPEMFGDTILVNGQAWPVLEVEPRQYRFRMLNGSDSRVYTLFLSSGQVFNQVGTDTGLLNVPVTLNQLTIAPGERADVVVDFSDPALWGSTIILRNNARTPFPKGSTVDPRTTGQIMAFRVNRPLDTSRATTTLPSDLRPQHGPIQPLAQSGGTRSLLLFEGTDSMGRLQALLGTTSEGGMMWDDPVTENPTLGDVEVWEIYNSTPDTHPIHLHLVSFQVISRQKFSATQDLESGALSDIRLIGRPKSPAANEMGWKDTVQMNPGEVTRIIARFDRPGEYVWHCHILSHEDHEMMRPYIVEESDTSRLASAATRIGIQTSGDMWIGRYPTDRAGAQFSTSHLLRLTDQSEGMDDLLPA